MKDMPFLIEVQLYDGGAPVPYEKYNSCLVTRHACRQQEIELRNRVHSWLCTSHYRFPEIMLLPAAGFMVCRVYACCSAQLEILKTHFHDEEEA